MAGLSDIIKQITAGAQAAREAGPGSGNLDKRNAAMGAINQAKQASKKSLSENAQNAYNNINQRIQTLQTMPPGMQASDNGGQEEVETSSITEDRENKKEAGQRRNPWDTEQYLADPYAIAMPTGYDMSQLSPEEQRQWAIDRGSEFGDLVLTLATLPVGGVVGGAAKGIKAAEAGEKALSAAQKAAKAEKALSATEAAGVMKNASPVAKDAARKAFDTRRAVSEKLLEEGAEAGFERGAKKGAEELGKVGENMFPTAVKAAQDSLAETARAADQAGRAAGGLTIAGMLTGGPLVQELLRQTAQGYSDSNREPLASSDNGNDSGQGTEESEGSNKSSKPQTQMMEFVNWATTTPEGQAFMMSHPEFFDGVSDYNMLNADDYMNNGSGYGLMFGNQDPEIWEELLRIPEWQRRYAAAGVDFNSDDWLNQGLDYIFGENAINAGNPADSRLQYGNLGDDALANAQMLRAISSMYGYGTPYDNQMGWDPNDYAYWGSVANILQNGWDGVNLDDLTAIAQAAGENASFGVAGKDGFEDQSEQRQSSKKYKARNLDSLLNGQITPWEEGGAPVYDQFMLDALIDSYNGSHNDRLGIKF